MFVANFQFMIIMTNIQFEFNQKHIQLEKYKTGLNFKLSSSTMSFDCGILKFLHKEMRCKIRSRNLMV